MLQCSGCSQGWLAFFLWLVVFFFFLGFGVTELEQEVRCVIRRFFHREKSKPGWPRDYLCFKATFGWVGCVSLYTGLKFKSNVDSLSTFADLSLPSAHNYTVGVGWKFSHLNFSVWLLWLRPCSSFLCMWFDRFELSGFLLHSLSLSLSISFFMCPFLSNWIVFPSPFLTQ